MSEQRLSRPYVMRAHWGGHAAGDEPTAATVVVWREGAAADEYLQADLQTAGPVPHAFPCVALGDGAFEYRLTTVPAVFGNLQLHWEMTATGPLTYPPAGRSDFIKKDTGGGTFGP